MRDTFLPGHVREDEKTPVGLPTEVLLPHYQALWKTLDPLWLAFLSVVLTAQVRA